MRRIGLGGGAALGVLAACNVMPVRAGASHRTVEEGPWGANARGGAQGVPAATQPAPDDARGDGEEGASSGTGGAWDWAKGVSDGRWLRFEELTFDLSFEARAERRSVRTDQRDPFVDRHRQTNHEWRFEETVGGAARGFVFDERVLHFDAAARWGLVQERYRENRPGRDLRASPEGDVLEYDVRADVFPAGKLSLGAWASQLDDRVPRPFLPSLDRRRERYGVGAFFNDPKLPMRLTYEHANERLESGDELLRDDEDRRDETLRYEATWQPTEDHSLRLEYEHDRRREKFSGTTARFDTRRDYVTIDHELRFGRDRRSSLTTLLRFNEERGDLARDVAEAAPQVRIQWTDSLSTSVRGQYLRESYQGLTVESYRGDLSATHELGEWLVGTYDFHGLRQDADANADGVEWGGGTNWSLSRATPWGRFGANLSYTHTAYRTDDARREGIVLNESVTFRDPLPAYLAHGHVVASSVVVTDAARRRVYLRGRDYTVGVRREAAALYRVPSGQIPDRETVLVSYLYRAADSFELTRDRVDLRVQHDFAMGLTPYYAGSIQDEEAGAGRLTTWRPRNVNRHRVGLTYRRPRWSAGAEFEHHDDAIDPYEALHFTGDAVLLENAAQQLSANVRASYFDFEGSAGLEARHTTLFDAGASYRYLLGERLEAGLSAMYRYEEDSLFGRTHGVDLSSSIAYRVGLLSVLLEVEYDLLDLPGSSDGTLAAWLKVKREIPVIGRSK